MKSKGVFIEKDKIKPDCPVIGVYEYWLVNKNTPSDNVLFAMVNFDKGVSSASGGETHNAEEIFYFLKGSGKVLVGESEYNIKPGLCVYIPKNVPHKVVGNENDTIEVLVIIGSTDVKTEFLNKYN